MNQLCKQLGLDKPIAGVFGIEIEAEGTGLSIVKSKYWKTEADGSLRGQYPEDCAEYILKKPIQPEDVEPALKELVKALEGAEFDFSYRTSVHIHVNVQPLTYVQLLNFIYVYLLLEEPLITYCGKSRKGNRFCLRMADAEGVLDTLENMFSGGERMFAIGNDNVRYSSMNLAALGKYGSLEFRGMRGTMEVDVIKTWTQALYKLREFAMQVENPKQILSLLNQFGASKFMENILGDLYEVFKYPRMLKDIARSYSLSLDLPYAYKEFKPLAIGETIVCNTRAQIPVEPPDGTVIEFQNNIHKRINGAWKLQGPAPIRPIEKFGMPVAPGLEHLLRAQN
jgi:hypothetical protein